MQQCNAAYQNLFLPKKNKFSNHYLDLPICKLVTCNKLVTSFKYFHLHLLKRILCQLGFNSCKVNYRNFTDLLRLINEHLSTWNRWSRFKTQLNYSQKYFSIDFRYFINNHTQSNKA